LKYEEIVRLDNQEILIRPAKPVDERRLQEHFYNLDKNDVISRFFHKKTSFIRDDVASMHQIDYVKEMTIVAVTGDLGFEKIVAVGGYVLDERNNVAEVAFSVSKRWQQKGLSKLIMKKLAEAAQENGIAGLVAYTSMKNKAMIRLFKTLPYKVKSVVEGDMVDLSARFDEPA
jgi:RimJ/RimL family protein N-acetyltransferase